MASLRSGRRLSIPETGLACLLTLGILAGASRSVSGAQHRSAVGHQAAGGAAGVKIQQLTSARSRLPADWFAPLLDRAEKIARIGAYLIGGFWVILNYRRGRTHRSRLEPTVGGEVRQVGTTLTLRIWVRVKNVGLSKVDIHQEGSGLRIFRYSGASDLWTRLDTLSLLESEGWIEPGECVEEGHLLLDFTPNSIFKVEAVISSSRRHWLSRRRHGEGTWQTTSYIM
jgi:hypothetical protein